LGAISAGYSPFANRAGLARQTDARQDQECPTRYQGTSHDCGHFIVRRDAHYTREGIPRLITMLLRLRPLLPPAVLFVLVAAFYWPITLTDQYELMWSSDNATQVLPWLQTAARQWQSGTFPLWDPYLWRGQPLLAQAQPGIAYPLNWILFSLPLRDGYLVTAYVHWYFIVIHWMAALFSYLLCRDLGLRLLPSLLGGVAFSLSCFMGTVSWPQMLNGAVWLPLIFLFLFRAAEAPFRASHAAFAGLAMGIGWLSGHHQVPLYTALAVGGTWAYFILRRGSLERRLLRQAALTFAVCGIIGALQILPAIEYGRTAKRWVNAPEAVGWDEPVPYIVHDQFSLSPSSVFAIPLPVHKGGTDPFLGLTIVTLAAVGLSARWSDIRFRILAVIAAAAVLYAFGSRNVFHGILYALVPMLEKARTPAMAVVLLGFGGSTLAAGGLEALLAGDTVRQWRRWINVLLWLGLALFVVTLGLYLAAIPFDDLLVISGFILLALAGLIAAAQNSRLTATSVAVLAVLLLFFELGTKRIVLAHKADENLMKSLRAMRSNEDIAGWLRSQPGAFRLNFATDAVPENWAAYHGIETQGGYLASVTENHLAMEFHTDSMNAFFGGTYTLGQQATQLSQREMFSGASGLKVFENVHAFSRSWVVHKVERIGSWWELNSLVQQNLQALRTTAYVTGEAPPLKPACNSTGEVVRLLRSTEGTVGFEAELNCDGLVILSETYTSGWRAEVDGEPVRVWEVNGSMRGVLVPAGSHTVTMRYRPLSVLVGASVTGIGVLAVVFLGWRDRKRTRSVSRELAASSSPGPH
jgi:hypothetical protein